MKLDLLKVCNTVEKVAATAYAFFAFNTIIAAGLLMKMLDQTNVFISIVTADLMLLLLIGQRVGMMALQKKIDELIHAVKGARDDLAGIENQGEEAIRKIEDKCD